MNRRNFLTTSLVAGAGAAIPARGQGEERFYYEFIRYEVLNRSKMSALENYWEKAAIPAFNRLGINPVGVFRSQYGSHGLDLHVLIPHRKFESFLTAWDQVRGDQAYQSAGSDFINAGMDDPSYYRFETSLLRAFSHMPAPEIPAHIKDKKSRLFEVRTYESHSRQKAKLKIEMFNQGGEIALFRETGLHPVMFAETLAGNKMPNLVYILGFENMEERDRNWQNFRTSTGWQKLRVNPRYKDTVSSVTDVILRPASCSQM